jgi:hypothetical protein
MLEFASVLNLQVGEGRSKYIMIGVSVSPKPNTPVFSYHTILCRERKQHFAGILWYTFFSTGIGAGIFHKSASAPAEGLRRDYS